jgi:hypothetical protein
MQAAAWLGENDIIAFEEHRLHALSPIVAATRWDD